MVFELFVSLANGFDGQNEMMFIIRINLHDRLLPFIDAVRLLLFGMNIFKYLSVAIPFFVLKLKIASTALNCIHLQTLVYVFPSKTKTSSPFQIGIWYLDPRQRRNGWRKGDNLLTLVIWRIAESTLSMRCA